MPAMPQSVQRIKQHIAIIRIVRAHSFLLLSPFTASTLPAYRLHPAFCKMSPLALLCSVQALFLCI